MAVKVVVPTPMRVTVRPLMVATCALLLVKVNAPEPSLVGFGQGVLDALIWFVIVWIPILLLLGVIGLVVWRVALEVRRRWDVAPEPPGTEPMR